MTDNIAAEVVWAYSLLEDRTWLAAKLITPDDLSVLTEIRRTESACTVLGSPDRAPAGTTSAKTAKFVVKRYLRSDDISQNRHWREFEGLRALHSGVPGNSSAVGRATFLANAPRPLAISANPAAVLMTAVEGLALEDWLVNNKLNRDRRDSLASTVIGGLCGFYGHSPDPHGDFHLGNLMIADASPGEPWSISFIDPGRSRPLLREQMRESTFGSLSVDMGYLLSFAGPTSPSRYLRQFQWVLRGLDVSVHIVLCAQDQAGSPKDFTAEVIRFAHEQISSTTDTWPLKATAVQIGKRALVEYARLRLTLHRRPWRSTVPAEI